MALFGNSDKRLRSAFNAVHREFEEHLESINGNTQEVLENRYMLEELQERLSKIASDVADIKQRLDEAPSNEPIYETIDLTLREQEVFLVLYTSEQGVNYNTISQRLSLPVSLVQELVYEMIVKGVPIIKQRTEHGMRISLDLEFREQQSKHNLVGIDEGVSKQLTKDFQLTLVE